MLDRLDVYLKTHGLLESREMAQTAIKGGSVLVNGKKITKCSYAVKDTDKVELLPSAELKYVSRAGLKLEKAITQFNIDFSGKVMLDIGSSTGGFTDCALQNGAKLVFAVDVGTDCMHPTLKADPRVKLFEQTNVLKAPSELFGKAQIITIDVSFVSITKILTKLKHEQTTALIVALLKPQFEVGKELSAKFKGVIKDATAHQQVIANYQDFLKANGFALLNFCPSPIKGTEGNTEYLSLLQYGTAGGITLSREDIKNIAKIALAEK